MLHTIYGFDDLGRKVPMGSYDDGIYPVGGIIFYIDSTSTATYKFYDANMNEISNIAVGDTPYYLKKLTNGNGKEMYYVFDNTLYLSKKWGYSNTITGATGDDIGSGKTNTATVIALGNPASNSIWYWLNELNTNKPGDCNDWYIGSKIEIAYLKSLADNMGNSLLDTSNNPISKWFNYPAISSYMWSSTETGSNKAYIYDSGAPTWTQGIKDNYNAGVFAIRSF